MPLTFILLQFANLALAAGTLWIHFRNPFMWDEQAIVIFTCAGTLGASLTAILIGINLVFGEDAKFGAALLNLLLTLAFAGLQGYFLFLTGRDMGIFQIIKAKLG